MTNARLIFEDGREFIGEVFAHGESTIGEVVFNTALTGYQEVITDPSYSGQIVLMTYPLIGNYGINSEDVESKKLYLNALLVREYCDFPSNWRSTQTLKSYLETHNILGVEGLDTRAITRYVRDKGAQRALLTTSNDSKEKLLQAILSSPKMEGLNLAEKVSVNLEYIWKSDTPGKYKIAVIDCGVKLNILRHLEALGCECKVFPHSVSFETILNQGFDGLFISNGPGDPEAVEVTINTIKQCLGKIPIFGICLGHQLLGLALGGQTYKLPFGHHGVNHPVKNLATGKVEITSQNHGFCLDPKSLSKQDIVITHINLNDLTVEGIKHKKYPAFSVQYHPESAPGPHDSAYLFEEFIDQIQAFKLNPVTKKESVNER